MPTLITAPSATMSAKPMRDVEPQAGATAVDRTVTAQDARAERSSTDAAGTSIRVASPRAPGGKFAVGNTDALVAGEHSVKFWAEQATARQEIEDALIKDAGHSPEDAPRALRLAVTAIAQAVLIQQSAFERIVVDGGPLTTKGRTRRSYAVWQTAADRVHRGLQLIGLSRVPRAIDPRAEIEQRVAALSPRSSRRRSR